MGELERKKEDIVLIIPAYNPDDKFIQFLKALSDDGWREIIVVDDGSRPDTLHYFEEAESKYGAQIVRHYVNLGQGRAFKNAFNYFLGKYGSNEGVIGVVECDCDGQHILKDVNRCAEILRKKPNSFVLGIRNFDDKSIPFRSRFGNKMTNWVFRFFCGLNIKDTQTGLKGIPKNFVKELIEAPGERFEYASSVLLITKLKGVEIIQFPISTIYIDGNATSHFNPLKDSIRIYSLIFGYSLSSLTTVVIDFIAFYLFSRMFVANPNSVYIAAALAKLFSGTYNFYVNKRHVFKSKGNWKRELLKYICLCALHVLISGTLISLLIRTTEMSSIIVKAIVDTILFFVIYYIQNIWVFNNEKK